MRFSKTHGKSATRQRLALASLLVLAAWLALGSGCGQDDPGPSAADDIVYVVQTDRDALVGADPTSLRIGPNDATDIEILSTATMPGDAKIAFDGLPNGVDVDTLGIAPRPSGGTIMRARLRSRDAGEGAHSVALRVTTAAGQLLATRTLPLRIAAVSFVAVRVPIAHHRDRGRTADRRALDPANVALLGYDASVARGAPLRLRLSLRNGGARAIDHLRLDLGLPEGSGLRVDHTPSYDPKSDWRIVSENPAAVAMIAPSHHVGGGVARELELGLDTSKATPGVHRATLRCKYRAGGDERMLEQMIVIGVHSLDANASWDGAALDSAVDLRHAAGGTLTMSNRALAASPISADATSLLAALASIDGGTAPLLSASQLRASMTAPRARAARAAWAEAVLADVGTAIGGAALALSQRMRGERLVREVFANPVLEVQVGRILTDRALLASADAIRWQAFAPALLAAVDGASPPLGAPEAAASWSAFAIPPFAKRAGEKDEAHLARMFAGQDVAIVAIDGAAPIGNGDYRATSSSLTVEVDVAPLRKRLDLRGPLTGALVLTSPDQVLIIEAGSNGDRIAVPIDRPCKGTWSAAFTTTAAPSALDAVSKPITIQVDGAASCDPAPQLALQGPPFVAHRDDAKPDLYAVARSATVIERHTLRARKLTLDVAGRFPDELGVTRLEWLGDRMMHYDRASHTTRFAARLEAALSASFRLRAQLPKQEMVDGNAVAVEKGKSAIVELTLPGAPEDFGGLVLSVKRNPVAEIIEAIGLVMTVYEIGCSIYDKVHEKGEPAHLEIQAPDLAVGGGQKVVDLNLGEAYHTSFRVVFQPGDSYDESYSGDWYDTSWREKLGHPSWASYKYSFGRWDVKLDGVSMTGGGKRVPNGGAHQFCSGNAFFNVHQSDDQQLFSEMSGGEKLAGYDALFPANDHFRNFFQKGRQEAYVTEDVQVYVFATEWRCKPASNTLHLAVDAHLCDAAYSDIPVTEGKGILAETLYWVHYFIQKERKSELATLDLRINNPYRYGGTVAPDHHHHSTEPIQNSSMVNVVKGDLPLLYTKEIEIRGTAKLGPSHHAHVLPPPTAKSNLGDCTFSEAHFLSLAKPNTGGNEINLPWTIQHSGLQQEIHPNQSVVEGAELSLAVTGKMDPDVIENKLGYTVLAAMQQKGRSCWSAPVSSLAQCGTFTVEWQDVDPHAPPNTSGSGGAGGSGGSSAQASGSGASSGSGSGGAGGSSGSSGTGGSGAGGGPSMGDNNCFQIYQCVVFSKCGINQSCISACTAKGTPKAQALFAALKACADKYDVFFISSGKLPVECALQNAHCMLP
jgi:hypothetical protein